MEEYQSIMKNDVWKIVPRLEGKIVVFSKWIFKIKHATNGSIEKYTAKLVAKDSLRMKGLIMKKPFLLLLDTPL